MNDPTITRRGLLAGAFAAVAFGTLGHLTNTRAAAPDLGRGGLPSWATGSPRTAEAYRAALGNADLLATLRCYCGCEQFEQPHASLRECYLRPDGSPEPHASGCDVCQNEALDAVRWNGEGVSWAEIRQRIDAEYSEIGPGCSIISCG